jgi:PAS domain S-box-containing protein
MEEIATPGVYIGPSRYLRWVLDLCIERNVDTREVLRHSPETEVGVVAGIEWNTFLMVFANLGQYFSATDLRLAGRSSWTHASFRSEALAGRALGQPQLQFRSVCGEAGLLSRLFPIDLGLEDIARGHLRLSLTMRDALPPCTNFQTVLAGQLEGIPESLGETTAEVTLLPTAAGATFEIWYEAGALPLARLQKFLRSPLTTWEAARELALISDQLLEKDRQIATAETSLRDGRNQARAAAAHTAFVETNMAEVIWRLSPDLHIQSVSQSIERQLGHLPAAVTGRHIRQYLAPTSVDTFLSSTALVATTPKATTRIEVNLMHQDGSTLAAELELFAADPGSAVLAVPLITVISRNIAERRRHELRHRQQDDYLDTIVRNVAEGIVTVDYDDTIRHVNPALGRLMGRSTETLPGHRLTNLIPGIDTMAPGDTTLQTTRADGEQLTLEARCVHWDGGRRTWMLRDVSLPARLEAERQSLTSALQGAQRMDAIGQLTGGIAHDFNNLLVAINGYAELGLDPHTDADTLRQYFQEIRAAGERAAEMTHRLLAFSRRDPSHREVVDVNEMIRGIEKMIDRLLPELIHVRFVPDLRAPSILADAGQIEQVIVNLAVNARDAMPNGGRLTIAVDQQDAGQGVVIIRVEDTGGGMAPSTRARIFEPFFTTKPEGTGTGLGMAVVKSIVDDHHGTIQIDSKPGSGTRIDVILPLVENIPTTVGDIAQNPAVGGTETILLVEDNDQVRRMARLMLESVGYRTVVASNGSEALQSYTRHRQDIEVVVMDVMMPGVNGDAVMLEMRRQNPRLPVLLTSGYDHPALTGDLIDFIKKPYSARRLREQVRTLIDRAKAP